MRDLVLWAVLRAFLVAVIVGWVPWPEQVNDLRIYADWAAGPLSDGQFPHDQMWQYPPLAGPVFLLGHMMPGDRFGFVLLFLAFDAAILLMVAHQASRTGRTRGRRLWAAAPIVTGPLLLARFDVVPTALAVAAVLSAARPLASGALATIGAWLKVWPALVLAGLRRSDLLPGGVGAVLASAVIAGTLWLTTTDPMSFLGGQQERGLQVESVAALPFLLARALGADVEVVYRYGAHEVQAPGVGQAAGLCLAATVVLLGMVAVLRLGGRLEHIAAADVALATVLFAVATSRVFSAQYFIWLLGLAAVCLGTEHTRMQRTCTLVVAAGLATHAIYPWLYSALLAGNPAAVAVQSARVALTVAGAVTAARVLLTRPGQPGTGSPPVADSPPADSARPGSA